MGSAKHKGFISYSHADREICRALYTALGALKETVKFWYDEQLQPGDPWKPEIAYHLKRSSIAIFITSRDAFRPGCYVMKEELPYAEELWKSKRLLVVSATARPAELGDLFLARTEVCPDKGKTLGDAYSDIELDEWCAGIVRALRATIEAGSLPNRQIHTQLMSEAVKQAKKCANETIKYALSADLEDGFEAATIVISKGVIAALKSPVADFRFDIDSILYKIDRFMRRTEVKDNAAVEAYLKRMRLSLSMVDTQTYLSEYPCPPGFIPAARRAMISIEEAKDRLLRERDKYARVDEEVQFMKQHNVEIANEASNEVEAKLAIGRALMSDERVDTTAIAKVNSDIKEITAGLKTEIQAIDGASTAAIDQAEKLDGEVKLLANKTELEPEKGPDQEEKKQAGVSLTPEFEAALEAALTYAGERDHQYATLEHLLLALTDDEDARDVILACKVNIDELRHNLMTYIDEDLSSLITDDPSGRVQPTAAFQRVVQRAVLHVESSGRNEVSGANALISLFSERESHAAYFLNEQDMTRYDAVNYLSHGVPKVPGAGR